MERSYGSRVVPAAHWLAIWGEGESSVGGWWLGGGANRGRRGASRLFGGTPPDRGSCPGVAASGAQWVARRTNWRGTWKFAGRSRVGASARWIGAPVERWSIRKAPTAISRGAPERRVSACDAC